MGSCSPRCQDPTVEKFSPEEFLLRTRNRSRKPSNLHEIAMILNRKLEEYKYISCTVTKLQSVFVYKGHLISTGMPVIVKFIRIDNMALLKSCLAYIGLPRSQRSKYLLTPEALSCDTPRRRLTLEYPKGVSLAEKLAKIGKFNLLSACKIIRSLVESIWSTQDLNQADFIHGNIKPENIIYLENLWRLCDESSFDKLMIYHDELGTNELLALNPYLPLEVISKFKGRDLNDLAKKFDVFSLGLVLAQMLGTPQSELPFANLKEELFNQKNQQIIESWRRKDQYFAALLDGMLGRKPEKRLTLREVGEKLDLIINSLQQGYYDKKPTVITRDGGFYVGSVSTMEVSPKDTFAALGCRDGSVYLFSLQDMKTSHCFKRIHIDWVLALAIDNEERYLVSGSHDCSLKIIDLEQKRVVRSVFDHHDRPISSIKFSRLGNFVVTASFDQTIKLVDVPSGNTFHIFLNAHGREISAIDLTPDDEMLVSASYDRNIKVTNIVTRNLAFIFQLHHQEMINLVKLSKDGRLMFSSAADRTIIITDFVARVKLYTFHVAHKAWIASIAISSDLKYLASCGRDGVTMVRDVVTHDNLERFTVDHTVSPSSEETSSVVFSNNSKFLFTALRNSGLSVMDLNSQSLRRFQSYHSGPITSLHISDENRYLISSSEDNKLNIYDLERRMFVKSSSFAPKEIRASCLSRDGSMFALAFSNIKKNVDNIMILSIPELKPKLKLKLNRSTTDNITCMSFSADDNDLVFTREDRHIYIKSVSSSKTLNTLKEIHDGLIRAFVVMKKNVIISADSLGSVFFTGVHTQRSLKAFSYLHPNGISCIALSQDEKFLATACNLGTIHILDLQKFRIHIRLPSIESVPIFSISFLNKTQIAYGLSQGLVKLFDLRRKSPAKKYDTQHGLEVNVLKSSKDGRMLVTGGNDNHICMINI